ncbi:hypothetical protein AVEN_117230-1 [Araneus ventricosus]|uniref:Transposase Tc1-like domain-containing protein n=1 Tax=Araneus ventricosus TaxID=182803 RepID=A0A4Y2AWQ0_ARAVE|nr:hypothetical protein AVEN_117230-1 [Araneus ventricosus]
MSLLGIYSLCKKYETRRSSENKRGSDRKPKTSTGEGSMNVRFAQKKNDISSREIVKDLKWNVSAVTVCLIVKNSWLISCIETQRPYISIQNMEVRLAFAKEHISNVSQF